MLNILDIIFLGLASVTTFTGVVINNFEKHVPAFIIKGYRYGSFAYKGTEANFLQIIEVPKSWYKHFYLFASCFGSATLIYVYLVYYMGYSVNEYVSLFLRIFLEQHEPSVSAAAVILATSLLLIQCLRRFYETYYVQVFAKSSKMNLSHYLAGIIHYFACFLATIGQAPLFCGSQNRENILWNDLSTKFLAIPCTVVFLWAWYEQYQSNLIFANLRKDKKSGQVITEDHRVPNGRLFNYVSSPHRMCEIILYTVLLLLIPTRTFFCIYLWVLSNQKRPQVWMIYLSIICLLAGQVVTESGQVITEDHRVPNGRLFNYVSSPHRMCEIILYTVLLLLIPTRTFFCIYLWVLSNQIQTAIQAHEWYKKTFKNYPTNRFIIFPNVL